MLLLSALVLLTTVTPPPCPDLTTNAVELCANRQIAAAWAEADAALEQWSAVDPRKAMIAERREEAIADLRRGFEYSADNSPQEANADQIVESLGYLASDADELAKLASSIATPVELGRDLARTCMVQAVVSCVVEAAGFLNAGGTKRGSQIAWQYIAGLEPNGGVPLRMIVAWDISGDQPVLIGMTSTQGEASPPRLIDNGEDMILHLPARTAGTGEGNADSLFVYRAGAWVNIGMAGWKTELPGRLPRGLGLWKGVEYDYYGLSSAFPLWREDDANCCPSGGDAYVAFRIVNDRLSIDTLQFTPAAAVQVKPLSCPILQATYRSSWPSRFSIRFEKPQFPPNAQTDLVAILEQRDDDDALLFTRHYSFAGSNGFGSASMFAVNGTGNAQGPPEILEAADGAETIYFHAFIGEPAGLKYIAEPPQADSPAPLGLFLPDLARSLWYDGIPDPKAGPPLRTDMPRDMWNGACEDAAVP